MFVWGFLVVVSLLFLFVFLGNEKMAASCIL